MDTGVRERRAAAPTGPLTRPIARPRRGPHPPAWRGDRRTQHVRSALRTHLRPDFRPDVEGLRALAVVAVVVYHANPGLLPGGYVGVDVFFVLSGFLITRLILRELAETGTLSLPGFWARRMRRLLPASSIMVLATALVGWAVLNPLSLRNLAVDVCAAATYAANFVFARRDGDYFAAQLAGTDPSPLLHMWSLAAEEQFYLVWPLVLWLLARRPRQLRRLLLVTATGMFAGGVLVSAWLTHVSQPAAYYLLPARAHELMAGALLALLAPRLAGLRDTVRTALAVGGIGAVLLAIVTFDTTTAFPGVAALLPVLGTAAVIAAGCAGPVRGLGTVLGHHVAQWVGRHSYSLYLWHWPVLVLARAQWPGLGLAGTVAALGVAVGLAVVSQRFVEDPARTSRWLSGAPWRGLALGTCSCLLLTGLAWKIGTEPVQLYGGAAVAAPTLSETLLTADEPAGSTPTVAPRSPATTATTASTIRATPRASTSTVKRAVKPAVKPAMTTTTLARAAKVTGKLATLTQRMQQLLTTSMTPAAVPSNLTPSLATARERTQVNQDGCMNVGINAKLQPCRYGVRGAGKTVLLYGDSHAAHWFEALEPIVRAKGYELIVLVKGGCPVTAVEIPTPVLRYTCPAYRDRAMAWIAKNKPDIVIIANSYTQYSDPAAVWAAGTEESVARLAKLARKLVIIGDVPSSNTDPPACLARHLDDSAACATRLAKAVHVARRAAEITSARKHHAVFVDPTDWFCAPAGCPAVVGNVLMLRDESHITPAAAELMQPLLAAALAPVLR